MATKRAMAVVICVLGTPTLWSAHRAHAAPQGDACSLLTETQVDAAVGAPVTTVTAGSDAKHCLWHQQGKRGEVLVEAHLLIEAAKTYDIAKNAMGMSGKATRVPISGIGDDAYYLVAGRDRPLFAKKGNAAIRIAVDGDGWSAAQIETKEKALASAVLAKL